MRFDRDAVRKKIRILKAEKLVWLTRYRYRVSKSLYPNQDLLDRLEAALTEDIRGTVSTSMEKPSLDL